MNRRILLSIGTIILPFISTNITSAVYQVFINSPGHSEWFSEPRNVDFIASKLLHSEFKNHLVQNKDYLNNSEESSWEIINMNHHILLSIGTIVLPFISTNITSAVYQVFTNAPDHSEWFSEPRNVDFKASRVLHSEFKNHLIQIKIILMIVRNQVGKTSTWIITSCFQ